MSINTNMKDRAVQLMPLNSLSLRHTHTHTHIHTHTYTHTHTQAQLERIPDFLDGIISPLLGQGSSYPSPSIKSLRISFLYPWIQFSQKLSGWVYLELLADTPQESKSPDSKIYIPLTEWQQSSEPSTPYNDS